MMKTAEYREVDGSFELVVPDGWQVERDQEDGGLLVSREYGCGLLHLMPFERQLDDDSDPAEELYSFLEDQEIELEEDEVEDLDLGGTGGAALCEYLAENGEELVYWLVAVAVSPGQLVFASYSCPAGEEDEEAAVIRAILESLRFGTPPDGPKGAGAKA